MATAKIFKQIPRIIFGKDAISDLMEIVNTYRTDGYVIFLVDSVHKKTGLKEKIDLIALGRDLVLDVDVSTEPKTAYVDQIRGCIGKGRPDMSPGLVVGIGGGSTMDVAKAISVLMTNEGSSTEYQGWDLVKNPAIAKLAIPTLSGTGSESSRTAVLTAKDKKFGINSDYSMYDMVLLDPELLATVPNDQRFYTGMDCYIHSVESLEGSFINAFGRVYASSALELCRKVFLQAGGEDEDLMVASFMGGASVANAEVGVCHALSYGLSLVLGFHHGIANCIVFNHLEEFYPGYVKEFKEMLNLNNIQMPEHVTRDVSTEAMRRMIEMTLKVERALTSALGENWRDILTLEKIETLYRRM